MTIEDIWFSKENMQREINKQCAMFEHIINKIQKSKSLSRRVKYAKQALSIANNGSTRYFSSDVIENVFLELAQTNKTTLSQDVIPNSVLHVASELYSSGGHSRILERWIQETPKGQTNALFLTRYNDIPESVRKIMSEKNAEIIQANKDDSDIETALLLRQVASKYERVILHVHMDDYIPIIAFGCNEFERPVYLFNHADHRFWLGVSIADKVLNFREFGEEIAKKYRGVKKSFYIPLLKDEKNNPEKRNIKLLKEKFGIPNNSPVLFTGGADFKYRPLLHLNFNNFLKDVVKRVPNITIVAIGPKIDIISECNIVNKSSMPYDDFKDYLSCADVVIDSFPFSGGTAILDAVSANKPVLSLKCPTGQLNYIVKSVAYCQTLSELVDNTCELLNSAVARKQNIRDVQKQLQSENISVWFTQRDALYAKSIKHHVNKFHSVKKTIDMLDYFMFQNTCDIKLKIHIPYLFDVFRVSCVNKKRYIII